MSKQTAIRLSIILIILIALGAWYLHKRTPATGADAAMQGGASAGGGKSKRGGFDPNRATPVQVATIRQGDMDIVLNALGTITANNTVTVHSRVDGQLVRVAFREGQMVKADDLLAQIDARPLQVQYEQMLGQQARDEAQLVNAQVDLNRYQGLLAQDSIAKQQVDAQAALVRQYQGTVKADKAQVDNAALQLSYATITAPISGRLGLRQVDVGNMVHASDANGLVVITQTQPITAIFPLASDNLPAVMAQIQAGKKLSVEAYDRGDTTKLASGTLLTVDNQIDTTTGTVKFKAEFPNLDNALFPNQFVNIHLKVETRHNVILAPVAAIQRGTPGTFVYVVTPARTVEVRVVSLGPTSGDTVAISKGLQAGEQVVIDGADKLRQGAKVEVITADKRGAAAGKGARHGKRGDKNASGNNPGAAVASPSSPGGPSSTGSATNSQTARPGSP